MNVVIVESAAKAKAINKYLGSKYKVLASYGHVRDLPPKDGSVEPDKDFHMHWDVDDRSQKIVREIAAAVKNADKLILATDPDREGEAISWHILKILEDRKALKKGLPSASPSTPSPSSPFSMRLRRRAVSTTPSSSPIWRAGLSTTWWASRSRRCCGASCRARARPAACSR
jgi:hypothetical protein